MENSELHWDQITSIAKKYWHADLSYLNDQQIELVQKAISEGESLSTLLEDHPGGYKFDIKFVLENAKVIFELIIVIANLVILLKEKKDDDILLEIKKAKKGKNIEIKMKDITDDDVKKIIKMIKAAYSK
jgi:hypothetical protein